MKKYTSKDLTVYWKPEKCIHSTNCWRQMLGVFNPTKRPWINLDAESSNRIRSQIEKCPSGALSYEGQEKLEIMEKNSTKRNNPEIVELEAGKKYAWCSCGYSQNQPYCDGSHKGTDNRPTVFEVKENKQFALCMCKKTNGVPFCDGSHAKG